MVFQFAVAPDLIRGHATLGLGRQKEALARIKCGPTKFLMATLVAILPGSVCAQTSTDEKRADIIVTAVGSEQSAKTTGQAVTLIDRTVIEARQNTAVSDLLSTTPGVTVSRNGGPGQPTTLRIRGAEGDQTLVLIDGVRANDPSAVGGGFDFGNLLIGNIDRIEVLRGPNSVPWGSQALGGIVNIVTARPTEGIAARIEGEYGSRDAKRLLGNISGGVGPVRTSFGAGLFEDDGISAFKFGTERDGFRQYAANGRVEIDLADTVTVDLRGNYADSRVAFDGFPPPAFAFADTTAFSTTKQAFGYAGINAALFDGALKNRLAFTIADTRRASFGSATAIPSRFAGRVERFEYQGDARAADWLRAVFGVEHETSRFDNGASVVGTGVTSGYFQAIVDPLPTVTLTGGMRVDDHRAYGTQATFSANAAWRIGGGTIVRASYGEGFKAPTLFQLFSAFGNAALNPETAQSFDIGVEQALLDGALRFGATYFHRNTTNQIDFATVPPRADRPFGYYLNIARTRAEGVESFVELRPTAALTLSANYTLTHARNRVTGADLLRRPRHSVNANFDWTTPFGLRIGAGVQTVSDSRDSDFRTFTATSLDGYTLVTVRAAMPVGRSLEIYGRIENATNTTYETVSGYGTPQRSAHAGVRVRL